MHEVREVRVAARELLDGDGPAEEPGELVGVELLASADGARRVLHDHV